MACQSEFLSSIKKQSWEQGVGSRKLKSGGRIWNWGRRKRRVTETLKREEWMLQTKPREIQEKGFWNYCDFVGEFEKIIFTLKKEEIVKVELFGGSKKKSLDPQTMESCICGEHHAKDTKGWDQQMLSRPHCGTLEFECGAVGGGNEREEPSVIWLQGWGNMM